MYKISVLAVFLLISFTHLSCSSDDKPEIEIIAPVNGNAFKQNTSFDIVLKVSDDKGVEFLTIVNTKLGVSDIKTFADPQPNVNYTLTVELGNTETDKYEFVIEATDTDGNKSDDKVEIEVVE